MWSMCLSKTFQDGLCHAYRALMDGNVAGDQAVQVLKLAAVVSEGLIRNIGHAASSFPENRFGSTGVPDEGAAARMYVEMGEAFADCTYL